MRWQQWTRWGTKNRAALLPFFPLCSTILKPHLESYYILSNQRIEIATGSSIASSRVSNLKNFIRFIRNSNIECNNLFARKSWKIRFEQISKPLFFTVTKFAPSSTWHRITVFLFLATDSFTAGRKQIRRKTLRCPWALRQYLRPHGE